MEIKRMLLLSSYMDNGGAEKWLIDTLEKMPRNALSVSSFYWADCRNDAFVERYNTIGVFPEFGKASSFSSSVRVVKDFLKNKGPFDIVHLNGGKILLQAICMVLAKHYHVSQRIVHCHNSHESILYFPKKYFRELLRKITIKNATVVMSCSDNAAKAKYGEKITDNPKYYLAKNGIEVTRFLFDDEEMHSMRDAIGIPQNATVYLHIGRFSEEKNHSFLIRLFKQLHQVDPQSFLVLVGSGETEDEIKQLEKELKINDYVKHIGYTTSPEKYYNLANCFLLPSIHEGFPLVLIEAQANGLKCFASDSLTREVNITNRVIYCPVNDLNAWGEMILGTDLSRVNTKEDIEESGFSIEKTALEFEKVLLKK